MIKWAKVINQETSECQVGLGSNAKYYASIGMTQMEVEQAYDGNWYLLGHAPVKPHKQEVQERIDALESKITDRNIRGALLGDEYAINKITQIETDIAELRKQLDNSEAN